MPFSGNRLHPTQKPVAALKPLDAAFSKPGDLVLDPFAGSGSTLLAARFLERSYIGMELDPAYHQVALKRLATTPDNNVRHGKVLPFPSGVSFY